MSGDIPISTLIDSIECEILCEKGKLNTMCTEEHQLNDDLAENDEKMNRYSIDEHIAPEEYCLFVQIGRSIKPQLAIIRKSIALHRQKLEEMDLQYQQFLRRQAEERAQQEYAMGMRSYDVGRRFVQTYGRYQVPSDRSSTLSLADTDRESGRHSFVDRRVERVAPSAFVSPVSSVEDGEGKRW